MITRVEKCGDKILSVGLALSLALMACVAVAGGFAFAESARQGKRRGRGSSAEWQTIDKMVASTPVRRRAALKRLGLHQGKGYLALISIRCGECDRVAKQLDQPKGSAVLIAAAPVQDTDLWAKRVGIKHVRIISVGEGTFEDLGAVLLPTVVEVEDGTYKRVREDGLIDAHISHRMAR